MEKLLLTEIDSLDNENGCYASNNYFAGFFQLSAGRISQIIKSLKEKKYVSCEYFYKKDSKEIEKRVLRILNTGIKNTKKGIKNTKRGYLENAKDNNTYNNNTYNNIKGKNEIISEDFLKYLEGLPMNDLVYNIENQKVELKQKQDNSQIHLCLKKNIIYIDNREFANIESFLNNDYSDIKIKNEVYLLYNEFQKDKNVDKLTLSLEDIKRMKKKQKAEIPP